MVDCVLDVRTTKRGKRYLIRWKQFEKDTWEPEENLVDCQEAIDLFYTKKAKEDKNKESKEDEIKKPTQLKTPNRQTTVKKEKQKTDVKTEVKSQTRSSRKVTVTQETEIRPTPLTRRSLRLSQKKVDLKSPIQQPEEISQKTTSSKICGDKKKCPVKYYFYIFCLIMIFLIVFLSLPKFTDDAIEEKPQ